MIHDTYTEEVRAGSRPGTHPRVVIAILNHNLGTDTIECIHSIQQCSYASYEIIVLDNGSTDGSYALLKSAFPELDVRSTGANLGYTGGINVCFRVALEKNPDYILVLNNDTVVEPSFLGHLVQAMEQHPTSAGACGTIYCHHDPRRVWYAGGKLVPWRGAATHNHFDEILDPSTLGDPIPVSFVTGCMVLFRVSLLNLVGWEDERFFMVLDDIELSARIRRKGYGLLYVPKAVIYHKVLGEKASPFKIYYAARNRLLLIKLAFGGVDGLIARLWFLSSAAVKLAYWSIAAPRFYKALRLGLEDYFRGRFGEGRGIQEFRYREQTQD